MRVESTEKPTTDEKFIALALERFRDSIPDQQTRSEALDDLKFRAGQQWDPKVKSSRRKESRPCLTINLLPQFLRQVTNSQRQNRPSVVVDPVDDFSDPQTAEVLQGIIRHIEVASDADVAYDTAFEYAAAIGFGFFRILTDYISPTSFDQEIKVERIINPFSVYFDPDCQKADFSDARWAFIINDMSREEFKAAYPDSQLVSADQFTATGNLRRDWVSDTTIRVAEYFYIEKAKRTLVLLDDESHAFKEDLAVDQMPEGAIVEEREVEIPQVHWCKISAAEKLEERDWPGSWIPIIPVLGEEIFIENKRKLRGMVRDSKDPQVMYNYWATAGAEMVMIAPKAPFIGGEGQFEGHESQWRQANRRNFPYLEYKPTTVDGRLVPPPQRQAVEPAIQAIMQSRTQAGEDLKSTMGIHNASLGAEGPETSGRAILARQTSGDTATYNYSDNMGRSIRHGGRVILELIPKIYDVPRAARIIGVDDQEKRVQLINDPQMASVVEEFENSVGKIERAFNIGVGRYDVRISAGPSYSTKRKEAAETMTVLAQSHPTLMDVAGDIMVKSFDWPFAEKIAARLKTQLPAAVQALEAQPDIPPQVVMQLQQLQQENQQLVEQLQTLQRQMEAKKAEMDASVQRQVETKQIEVDARERIEAMKLQVDLIKTQAQIQSDGAMQALQEEITALRDVFEQQSFGRPV